MARDSKKNAAYDSGMRGGEKRGGSSSSPKLAGGARSITIRPVDNGFTVDCSYPPKKNKPYDWEPETHVFQDAHQVAEFIEGRLGVDDGD